MKSKLFSNYLRSHSCDMPDFSSAILRHAGESCDLDYDPTDWDCDDDFDLTDPDGLEDLEIMWSPYSPDFD